jgi:hypothetical protein
MIWMRLIPYAASGALVAALWWLWTDRADKIAENARLAREIAAQARIIEQAHEARAVEEARAERFRQRAADLDANIQAIVTGGIPDAPLDPRLADLINGRLRSAED